LLGAEGFKPDSGRESRHGDNQNWKRTQGNHGSVPRLRGARNGIATLGPVVVTPAT
jgi:hypothetical protein